MAVATQIVTDFILTGALYTLIAIGLSLIFSVMRIINFAHAQMYMAGAYGVYLLNGRHHVSYWVALLLSAAIVGLSGILIERIVIRPVQSDPARAMIATLGLLLILGGVALIIFGETGRYVTPPITSSVPVFGTYVDKGKLVDGAIALGVVILMFASLKMTKAGRAMRALAQDQIGARLQGVRVSSVRSLGFAVGCGLAAIAGGLILPLTSATPDMGNDVILKMFIILIIGGLGSIMGAVIGAFTLAFLETVGVTYTGQYAVLFVYLLVIAILLVRPQGLLGGASA
jgi:branched-chain amino acid transport system permease protein